MAAADDAVTFLEHLTIELREQYRKYEGPGRKPKTLGEREREEDGVSRAMQVLAARLARHPFGEELLR